ncbi:MAG: amino acid deaminase/aldolase [Chloroflexi bacterium]|nr:amino acid deaminase/aldolase [Chloroflexota bacterium]MDL1941071.1 amino acid deaminase/aldolase [Chloroflexi bacterium CFX2]
MAFTNQRYETLRDLFKNQRLPLAFVDLDAFDDNVDYAASLAKQAGKTLRLGTKSLRCLPLMERVLAHASRAFRGFLTFTAEETAFLADRGHDDFLLAYPTVQREDMNILAWVARKGKQLSVMVDSPEHLQVLDEAGKAHHAAFHVCLEIDMAYRPLGNDVLHLGLRRSPIRTVEQAVELVRFAKTLSNVKIDSIMGYEGHIAGTNDDVPGQGIKNAILRGLKKASVRELSNRRRAVVGGVRGEGVMLRFVNGGGSGSLVSTLQDESVTEGTIGSGLYASGLFHYFKEVHFQPSAFFALQVVRKPKAGMVTCAGGGYVASGAMDKSKLPLPVMPVGLKYVDLEGAGEVQTPLVLPQGCPTLHLGDPVFFQHAKAGELCERFNELILIQGGKIVETVKTYRGEGFAFL